MPRLPKIPIGININLRRIILGYAVDEIYIRGDIDLETYKWYSNVVKSDNILIMTKACRASNIELFKWSVENCASMKDDEMKKKYMTLTTCSVFNLLGRVPSIDMARLLVEMNESLGICSASSFLTEYNIDLPYLISTAYTANHRCTVHYLIMNFDLTDHRQFWGIRSVIHSNKDYETLKYVHKKRGLLDILV